MAVSEFSTVARPPAAGAGARAYTTVTDATIANIFDPYINNDYQPGRQHQLGGRLPDGPLLPAAPEPATPHLTVFITDGDPNEVIRGSGQHTTDNANVAQNE